MIPRLTGAMPRALAPSVLALWPRRPSACSPMRPLRERLCFFLPYYRITPTYDAAIACVWNRFNRKRVKHRLEFDGGGRKWMTLDDEQVSRVPYW